MLVSAVYILFSFESAGYQTVEVSVFSCITFEAGEKF